MSAPLIDIGALVGLLAGRAEALCSALLPLGVREGAEWRIGSVAGEAGRSMGVRLTGPRAGVWKDWNGRSDDQGDALDLVAKVLFAGDKGRAIQWSRAWLGLGGGEADMARLKIERRRVEAKRKREAASEEATRRFAFSLWLAAEPRLRGTLAERYLLARAIDFAALGRQPRALRFARELTHPETGEVAPALLAMIAGPTGEFAALHRTFLEEYQGSVRKLAGVEDAKLTLGRYAGGAIRLWRGASGREISRAPEGEWVMIGEGIEDTATAVTACSERRALVAVSGGNVVRLPKAIAGVILLGQNEDNAAALRARASLVAAYQAQGKEVRLALPPAHVKDINELAQKARA